MSKATKRERQKENRERAREERERLLKRDRRMKATRGLLILLIPLAIIALVITLTGGDDTKATPKPRAFDANKNYTATIETSEGTIVAALDAKNAPKATKRFIRLADRRYYDGLCFDRLSPDFVIQGGSPTCDQQGGEGNPVVGEVPTDNYPVGSLAAAKGGGEAPGTFDSQFFVVTGSRGATLPNDYARFGTVTAGLDIAQKIEKLPVEPGTEKPAKKITIKRIRITVTNPAPAPAPSSAPAPAPAPSSAPAPAPSSTTAPTSTTVPTSSQP